MTLSTEAGLMFVSLIVLVAAWFARFRDGELSYTLTAVGLLIQVLVFVLLVLR